MSERTSAGARPSLSQQILRSFRPRAAAPLASPANASPAHRPLDHRHPDFAYSTESGLPPIANAQINNPFDLEQPSSPEPSPIEASASALPHTPADEFRSHLIELLKPLPLGEPKRKQTIQDRCRRLGAITTATATLDPVPPQGQVFRLVIGLLGGIEEEQFPLAIKEAACELMIKAIQHSDQRAAASPQAVIETRSGAPGSQSSKSLDSDQPLANIDRALLYRLVVEMVKPQETDEGVLPTKDDLSRTSLPCLQTRLRALHVLSKEGKDVVAFDGIVQLLLTWLIAIWKELQILRQLAKLVNLAGDAEDGSTTSESGPSSQPINRELYAEQLSSREWSCRAILHLLTAIIKFNFARVDHKHIESTLQVVCSLFLAPLPDAILVDGPADASLDSSRDTTASRMQTTLSGSRSRSRDHRAKGPLTEGYSYYGLEAITPESGPSSTGTPHMTPRLGPRMASGSVAPINLATLPPAKLLIPSRLSLNQSADDNDSVACAELQDVEVRAVLLLLDTTLTYGYMPPSCVAKVSQMVCRILGSEITASGSSNLLANTASSSHEGTVLTPWQTAALPVLSNLLRSHSANNTIKVVRSLLCTQDGEEEENAEDGATSSYTDEGVLIGAVVFLRLSLLVIARTTTEAAPPSSATNPATTGASAAAASTSTKENALAPRMSIPLILPALRGALQRQSDLIDLQVLLLVEGLIVAGGDKDSQEGAKRPALLSNTLKADDWTQVVELMSVASKRHLESWMAGRVGAAESRKLPLVIHALLNLLSNLSLSSPDQLAAQQAQSDDGSAKKGSLPSTALPWTPVLSSLLLSLATELPSELSTGLIEYHRTHHLCLPCTPEWISNLKKLLQSYLLGHLHFESLGVGDQRHFGFTAAAKPWQEKTRQALADLLFDDVYESVVSFPQHRALLMREVILPTARMLLPYEPNSRMEQQVFHALVQAAALSSVATEGAEGEGESIFDATRELLCQMARAQSGRMLSLLPLAAPGQHKSGHVHFTDAPGSHEHRGRGRSATVGDADQAKGTTNSAAPASRSGTEGRTTALPQQKLDKSMQSAISLIAIFNQIAFASPWVDFDSAQDLREEQEKKARASCIALFRDLLSLIQVDAGGQEASVSPRTKLAILQWFLRIRTDRHHRVYLVGDLDELIEPSAAIILKTAESQAAAEAAAASGDKAREARAARAEGRGRETGRRVQPPDSNSAAGAVAARSESRARNRESSRDRGRLPEKTIESPRRAGDRSTSAVRNVSGAISSSAAKKPAAELETLWQVPQSLAFEMPTSGLRSDIVYTYIHKDDPSCSHHHQHPSGDNPLPLPVSDLMAGYIKIMTSERDWELASYVICHLPHQLANKHLFCGPKAQVQIIALRQYLCSSILQQKYMADVVLPDDIKRSDVYAVAYATLTALLSYRALFSRSEQDELVEAFIAGLNKSQNTAQPCVRALSVAVYEAQKSVTRLLPSMLVKLSTIMSSMTMSVHILELIASIGQIPACYVNFTEAEYRRVFGIALQYIQYHQSPAGASAREASPTSFTLSQYVMMLAYYNITSWFMTLRISDRAKHVGHITRGLQVANEGREKLSDQTEVCFDFLARFTHSNADPKPTRSFINSVVMGPNSTQSGAAKDPNRVSKTWLVGKGLISFNALRKEGWMKIIVRRASGTTALLCKIENVPVTTLPEEDGERVDLPAALMMSRDAETMSKPVLRAPWSWKRRTAALDEVESKQHRPSIQQAAQETILAGEHLRSMRPNGPAQFGLGQKPRRASYSGAIGQHDSVTHRGEGPPYGAHGDKSADEEGASAHLAGQTNAITKVMKDILDEGANLAEKQQQQGETTSTAEKAASGSTPASATAAKPAGPLTTGMPAAKDICMDPSTIALQLSSYPDFSSRHPILLPDEPATARLIRGIDLIPVVDLHKIGCLYVAPGQRDEVQILGNRNGSPAYTRFLSGLGELITLKGQENVYTGGLDREADLHGKYAYAWLDEIAQIVFHAATMMPNRPNDYRHSAKKALIGNDWVHIVFNESGDEYAFGTIPSQFNYVNIVISPTTKGGTTLGSVSPGDTTFYRVSLQRRPGLPSFSPVGDGQLISASALPIFVRSLALNANVLSQIYNDTGESMQPYSSNWCNRLNHVARYRSQFEVKKRKERETNGGGGQGGEEEDVDPRDFTGYT